MAASPGRNIYAYYVDVVNSLTKSRANVANIRLDEAAVLRQLNIAHEKVFSLLDVEDKEASQTITAGTSAYDLPADMLGRRIKSIRLMKSSGKSSYEIPLVSYARLEDNYNLDDVITGTPEAAAIIPNTNQLEIRPVPDTTVASTGLRVRYGFLAEPFWRIYRQTTVKLTVNNGDTTKTSAFNSAPDSVLLQPGDEIAAMHETAFSGEAINSGTAQPVIWNTVASTFTAGSTTLVLNEPWAYSNVSGVNFISAHVPDVDRLYPGKFGKVLTNLAAYELLKDRDASRAATFITDALDSLSDFDAGIEESILTDAPGKALPSTFFQTD